MDATLMLLATALLSFLGGCNAMSAVSSWARMDRDWRAFSVTALLAMFVVAVLLVIQLS